MNTDSADQQSNKKERHYIRNTFLFLVFLIFAGITGFQQMQIMQMKQQIERMQYVYVYSLEETLHGMKLDEITREFEAKVKILTEEVASAQEKISSLKDAKEKDNFSDVYLKSLKLKRDMMIKGYKDTLQNMTNRINEVMTEIALERGTAVIFDRQFINTETPQVIDVTDDIVKRIKFERPRFLDE